MFKEIKGTNGAYSCDKFGNIKSNSRLCWNGTGYYMLKEKILKPYTNNKGYLVVDLRINNKTKKCLVHRIVAETFIPNPNNYPIINHKDNNPLNNNIENLEWCTYSYNLEYCYNQNRRIETEARIKAQKLPSTWLYKKIGQYDLNGDFIKSFESLTEAAKSIYNKEHRNLNSIKTNISSCCNNKAKSAYHFKWKYINNEV